MSEYRNTVQLPVTPFPMRGDLLVRQQEILVRWQAQDLYRAILEDRRDAPPFIIHDGPPYAMGKPNVGLGLNKILKDVIAKFHSMSTRHVPMVPGWDCHGWPIEFEIRKTLGPRVKEMTALEIRRLCQEMALRYVMEETRQFQLLGVFGDWDRPYLTMHPTYESRALGVLLELYKGGYIKRAKRPISWCTECQTALAEAEEEKSQVKGNFLWLWYDCGAALSALLGDGQQDIRNGFLIWTTDAWTLPGATAVAVNPALEYGIYDCTDHKGIHRIVAVLNSAAAEAFRTTGIRNLRSLRTVTGAALVGIHVRHPLFERDIPVIAADFVVEGAGSGVVHIAPAHAANDFAVASQNKLAIPDLVAGDGRYSAEAGVLQGEHVLTAEPRILDILRERQVLVVTGQTDRESITCGRCGKAVITRVTDQWFVRVDHRKSDETITLREKALAEIELLRWVPPASRQRMRAMLESRPDWCISRQRVWGVPLPSAVCKDCGNTFMDAVLIERVRDAVAEHGSDVWFGRDLAEIAGEELHCLFCNGTRLEKGGDILDVWFESSASWQALLVADHRLSFPADLVIEGD